MIGERRFLELGGDSVTAVVAARTIESMLKSRGIQETSLVLDLILHKTIDQVVQMIADPIHSESALKESKSDDRLLLIKQAEIVKYCCQKRRLNEQMIQAADIAACLHSVHPYMELRDEATLKVDVQWKFNLGKCIDASPLIVTGLGSKDVIIIGSHSRNIACLDAHSGELIWNANLPDRVESSAALTQCGRYVVVGCYDGGIYFLGSLSGEILWCCMTADAVKSSPCIWPASNWVFCGSHDGYVYALDATRLHIAWKVCPVQAANDSATKSAIFSSPVVDLERGVVYACTLSGMICQLNARTGVRHWDFRCESAIFASPSLHRPTGHVIIGCTDHAVYCISVNGMLLWKCAIGGQIFSSATIINDRIFFGAHDGKVHCVNVLGGTLLCEFSAGSGVFSSPALLTPSPNPIVVAFSMEGVLMAMDPITRRSRTYKLPGQVFSSAVCLQGTVYIGCRDDHVYALQITM